MTITDALLQLFEKKPLTREQSRGVFKQLMAGQASSVQIAALLAALRVKGETVEEVLGAAEAMREAALTISGHHKVLIDTCGTGGDHQGTFNISTAAAFVVAGAGFAVAKHGNRSISSRSGSADVLEALGIAIQATPGVAERSLQEKGIAFLYAPAFHPAMKFAMPVRKELGARTLFNLLGPLTNPARPTVQVVGLYSKEWVHPIAKVLVQLGVEEGYVVHGRGHDEIVLTGPTYAAEIRHGKVSIKALTPALFGYKTRPRALLRGGDATENAKTLHALLSGQKGDLRDAVCMNAAAAIESALRVRQGENRRISLKDAARLAEDSIDSGRAKTKLLALAEGMRPHG